MGHVLPPSIKPGSRQNFGPHPTLPFFFVSNLFPRKYSVIGLSPGNWKPEANTQEVSALHRGKTRMVDQGLCGCLHRSSPQHPTIPRPHKTNSVTRSGMINGGKGSPKPAGGLYLETMSFDFDFAHASW